MSLEFEERCKSLVQTLGLCRAENVTDVRRLTGGVASDIAAVTFDRQTVCVKFALNKLRVDEDWFAPVHRNQAEYAWLSEAGKLVPAAVPALYGWSEDENGFAMEFIAGPDVTLWKSALLDGKQDLEVAANVASVIGRIHAASVASGFNRAAFDNAADFESLRIEPYLRFTAGVYPHIARRLSNLADQLAQSSVTLVHGDVSPKNIIVRNSQPIILDAECATMGDPAFDVAFCLNHLLLKFIHLPESRTGLQAAVQQFWNNYSTYICWEEARCVEARVAALLPALMLARVDGKSPVEYLAESSRLQVRTIVPPLIERPVDSICSLLQEISREIET